MIEAAQVRESLLRNELIVFASDYGKKAIAESWAVRLSKQVKKLDQFKEFQNYNIATGGDTLVVDIDLDCPEALLLADYFIPSTKLEFGRASTPRSHRLLKVIDLNKKHGPKDMDPDDLKWIGKGKVTAGIKIDVKGISDSVNTYINAQRKFMEPSRPPPKEIDPDLNSGVASLLGEIYDR